MLPECEFRLTVAQEEVRTGRACVKGKSEKKQKLSTTHFFA
jgi:hypothetical protein